MELLYLQYLNPFRWLIQSSLIPVYGSCNLLIHLKSSLQSCSSIWISTRAYFGLEEKSMTCTKLPLDWVCYFKSWQKRLKMSMKLDVGGGERRGCESWLRSELIPYSKGVWFVPCTCIAPWSQVGFVSPALHSSSSCCVCTSLSEFCIWIERWKIISWFEVFLISFNVTSQCFVERMKSSAAKWC